MPNLITNVNLLMDGNTIHTQLSDFLISTSQLRTHIVFTPLLSVFVYSDLRLEKRLNNTGNTYCVSSADGNILLPQL